MVTILRAVVASCQDDLATVRSLEPELLAIPDDATDFVLANRRNTLAWLYNMHCEYARVRDLFREDGIQSSTLRIDLVGRCLLGMSYLLEGEMQLAERIFRAALEDADAHGVANGGPAFMAAGQLSEVLYEINEVEAAGQLLAQRLVVLERTAIPDTVLRVLIVQALWHRRSGRYLESWERLEQLEDYATEHGLDRIHAHSLLIRSNWHLQEKDEAAAQAVLPRLEALAAANPTATHGPEVALCLYQARALVLLRGGEAEQALAELKAAVTLCRTSGRLRAIPHLNLITASVLLRIGRQEEAWQHALEALRQGHRHGLVRSMLDAPGATSLLAKFEAECGSTLDPVLAFYVHRLRTIAAPATRDNAPAPNPHPPSEKLSDREREVAELLEQAMPNKKIARALGVTPETVKWHLKRIYTKLGVAGRDAAVARLRDLRLTSEQGQPPGSRT